MLTNYLDVLSDKFYGAAALSAHSIMSILGFLVPIVIFLVLVYAFFVIGYEVERVLSDKLKAWRANRHKMAAYNTAQNTRGKKTPRKRKQ